MHLGISPLERLCRPIIIDRAPLSRRTGVAFLDSFEQ